MVSTPEQKLGTTRVPTVPQNVNELVKLDLKGQPNTEDMTRAASSSILIHIQLAS